MNNFFAYKKSKEFFNIVKHLKLPYYASDQIKRAAFSVPLNLSEGYARFSRKDKLRFYKIAFASLKECKAILELQELESHNVFVACDYLCAILYRLIKSINYKNNLELASLFSGYLATWYRYLLFIAKYIDIPP